MSVLPVKAGIQYVWIETVSACPAFTYNALHLWL